MNRLRYAIAPAVVIAVAAPAAVSLAATSHAKLFENMGKTAACGVMNHPPKQAAKWVVCEAAGIPRPKNAHGDPAVRIARTGKPQLITTSQIPFVTNHSVKLGQGATWSSLGVTCKIVSKKAVKCSNTSGHGFTIGNGHYKSF